MDVHTPAAWIYAFRLDSVVRIADVKFHEEALPFRDPMVLVNPGHLTDDQVVAMHKQDMASATHTDDATQEWHQNPKQ